MASSSLSSEHISRAVPSQLLGSLQLGLCPQHLTPALRRAPPSVTEDQGNNVSGGPQGAREADRSSCLLFPASGSNKVQVYPFIILGPACQAESSAILLNIYFHSKKLLSQGPPKAPKIQSRCQKLGRLLWTGSREECPRLAAFSQKWNTFPAVK